MTSFGVLYYSDNAINMRMALACRKYIEQSGLPITSVTLKPTSLGRNIVINEPRGYETMYKQIITGLEAMTEDVVFFCEHDTLYNSHHFEFIPERDDTWYYNGNYWFLRMEDGFAIHYDVSPLSGLVVYREPAIIHFRERLEWVQEHGFGLILGFEPFTHRRIKWKNWYNFEKFMPEYPNVDLCHGGNLTKKRWHTRSFIRKPKFWEESDMAHIPGWPDLPKIVAPFFPQKEGKKIDAPVYRHKPPQVAVQVKLNHDLSVVIPARNEQFLGLTIKDILANIEGDTEIITVLDGYTTPVPDLPLDHRVKVITLNTSIGQRAATNLAVRQSTAKYVAKTDAHCAFDKGFDAKLMSDMRDDWTVVPIMRNLHVFDWVCPDGHRRYQGPSGVCTVCGKDTIMDTRWIAKTNPQSRAYRFDTNLKFQYFREFSKRPEGKGDLTESMSLQGSFFMMTREKYWNLNICDESWGSWGQQGSEVSIKTWLSGGRVVVNQKTYYAHLFRTQGGTFGFPYPISGSQVEYARNKCKDLFLENKWEKQVYPLSWLIEKFAPVPEWHDSSGKEIIALVTEAGTKFKSPSVEVLTNQVATAENPSMPLALEVDLQSVVA